MLSFVGLLKKSCLQFSSLLDVEVESNEVFDFELSSVYSVVEVEWIFEVDKFSDVSKLLLFCPSVSNVCKLNKLLIFLHF